MNKDIKNIALVIMTKGIKNLSILKAEKDACTISVGDKRIFFLKRLVDNEEEYVRITIRDKVVMNTDISFKKKDEPFYDHVNAFIEEVYFYSKQNILNQVKEKLK